LHPCLHHFTVPLRIYPRCFPFGACGRQRPCTYMSSVQQKIHSVESITCSNILHTLI
jgi:hypothetical protein